MNAFRTSAVLAAWFIASMPFGALAQTSGTSPVLPNPGAAASAPPLPASAANVGPRLRSPAETGNRAVAPVDLRPVRPVSPQISIPFGKKQEPAPPKGEARGARRGSAIDDAAARCESQSDDGVRAACRAQLAREAKGKLPN